MLRYAGNLGVSVAVFLTVAAAPAAAQRIDYHRVIEIARVQQIATLQMTNDALLMTMSIDADLRSSHLRSARVDFDRNLKALRDGDPALGLPEAVDPQTLDGLESALDLWTRTDAILRSGQARTSFTDEELLDIAGQGQRIRDGIADAVEFYAGEAKASQMASMVNVAIDETGNARLLSQRISNEFLMIVHGLQADRYRRQLIESIADFERRLNGLVDGDVDLLLLPAPTDALRSRLRRLQIAWQEDLEPLMRRVIDGGSLTPEQIAEAARLNRTIFDETTVAIGEYRRLMP
ncbi:MAG: hypothetical protein HKM95_11870 [Inquilinus sp.]|nr:hypothetical protein [Inquilinus sp.]